MVPSLTRFSSSSVDTSLNEIAKSNHIHQNENKSIKDGVGTKDSYSINPSNEIIKNELMQRQRLQMSIHLYNTFKREKESREVIESEFITNVDLEGEIYKSIDPVYFNDPRMRHPGGLGSKFEPKRTPDDKEKDVQNTGTKTDGTRELGAKFYFGATEESILNKSVDSRTDAKKEAEISVADCDLLSRLPSNLDLGFIMNEKKRLSKQLMVVSKREHELIIKKQPILIVEFSKLQELHSSLTELITLCARCRKLLGCARKELVVGNMKVLSCYNQKLVTAKLMKSLGTVKSLQSSEVVK